MAGPPTTALLSSGLATSVSKSWSCLSLQTPLLGPVLDLLEALGFVNGLGLEELASIDDKPAVPNPSHNPIPTGPILLPLLHKQYAVRNRI